MTKRLRPRHNFGREAFGPPYHEVRLEQRFLAHRSVTCVLERHQGLPRWLGTYLTLLFKAQGGFSLATVRPN